MSDALILIGGDSPSAVMAWARIDPRGRVLDQAVVGQRPLPSMPGARTVLILPGADARLTRLTLPARSEAQARAGAEAMLGATLAGGEAMHYAIGSAQDSDGTRLVAAIAQQRMTHWLERCAEIGADPHVIALDCTLWPVGEDEIVIAITANRAIVTGGPLGGFAIEPALAGPLAARWLAEVGAHGKRIMVQGGDAGALRAALGREVETQTRADPIDALAQGAAAMPSHVPNLRQGAFSARQSEAQPLKLWRFAALLLAAAVMLQVGSLLISGWRDARAADQIMAAAERDFREARPEVRRVVNLRAQVAALANAAAQSANHPVIVTSEPLIAALRQQPLARIDEVRHEGPARSVRILVSAPQREPVDALLATLREQGVEVQTRDVAPRDGRYAAELTLEAAL